MENYDIDESDVEKDEDSEDVKEKKPVLKPDDRSLPQIICQAYLRFKKLQFF